MTSMASDVFISYSRKDSAAAELVQRRLEASGITSFRDVTNIAGSERWMEALARFGFFENARLLHD